MRPVLLILILVVVGVIIAVASGFLDIDQVRGGQAPTLAATDNGVTATGGQAPAFDVQTGSVKVGTQQADVKLPTVQVAPPESNQANTQNAM
jgi:hypothetical protein